MKKFMYFAEGNGADASTDAAAYEAGKLVGVIPLTTTTSAAYFERNLGEWDNKSGRDKITFAHDNTTDTTGHRCKDIGRALAEAANAGPHVNGMTDVVDLDNSLFISNLSFVTGVTIELDI